MTKKKYSRRTRMWLENLSDLPDDLKEDLAKALEKQEKEANIV